MKPIVLIHGYGSEHGTGQTRREIASIYGSLPRRLRQMFRDPNIVEVDVGRYITLEDGISLDDISRGLDMALRDNHPDLIAGGFNVIIHSTGALVVRNWIRRFSAKPSPIENLVYLAGANFGSGWAHIGKGQLAKWGQKVFRGTERGVQVLDSLEFGSNDTIDMHLHFVGRGQEMFRDYQVCEYVLIGSQAKAEWLPIPVPYAKEDGSDGVVRVSASNLNFSYAHYGPSAKGLLLTWQQAERHRQLHARSDSEEHEEEYYERIGYSVPGQASRPVVPFAIPYRASHFGSDTGIVSGRDNREQVEPLLELALTGTQANWAERAADFDAATDVTYQKAARGRFSGIWFTRGWKRQVQYEPHCQVIVRVRDQDGRPIEYMNINFGAVHEQKYDIGSLIVRKHVNKVHPNTITFYMRTHKWSDDQKDWLPLVPSIGETVFEVSATEPETGEIAYLPLRLHLSVETMNRWITKHQTTVLDITLLRLPSPEVFNLVSYP